MGKALGRYCPGFPFHRTKESAAAAEIDKRLVSREQLPILVMDEVEMPPALKLGNVEANKGAAFQIMTGGKV
jgi:hypothetical protein